MTLTCPSESNMAAVAKQLHATALQAEQEIYAAEQEMREAVNLPTVVVTSTANLTGISSGTAQSLTSATFATTFDNTAGGSGGGSGTFGPQNFGFFTSFLGEGIYEVGLCATAVASGAVDNNSVRYFYVEHKRPDPTVLSGEFVVQRVGYTMFESNTGVGAEVSFVGTFRAKAGDRFEFLLLHGNSSSTLTVNTGMIMWASRLSETSLERVL